jgi:hypothetical protein
MLMGGMKAKTRTVALCGSTCLCITLFITLFINQIIEGTQSVIPILLASAKLRKKSAGANYKPAYTIHL